MNLRSASGNTGGFDVSRLLTLNVTAKTVNVLSNFALASGSSNLTVGAGGVNAIGYDLAGFNLIQITNSNYEGRDLSANKLIFNLGGDLILTGNLTAAIEATTPGSMVIGGLLAGDKITAGKSIDAGSVSAKEVTFGTVMTIGSGGVVNGSGSTIIKGPNLKWGAGAGIALDGLAGTASQAPGRGGELTLETAAVTFAPNGTGVKHANLSGGDAHTSRADKGGNGGTLTVKTTGAILVDTDITATSGLNSVAGMTGGNGGTVSLTSDAAITVNSKIETSSNDGGRRVSAKGGDITINSKATTGTTIQIGSTANLQALLSNAAVGTGGTVTIKSSGGTINMNGTARADRGTVDIKNSGSAGRVNLTNSTLSADVVKVNASGPNGVLTIGGGMVSADTTINLYASGSNGTVNFIDNVTLNGNSVKTISGNTVTIANGKIVTVNGPNKANVFTNNPNYTGSGGNNSTTGTFGGKGAATQILALNPNPGGG